MNVDKRRAGLWADSPDLSALFLPPAEKRKAKDEQQKFMEAAKRSHNYAQYALILGNL